MSETRKGGPRRDPDDDWDATYIRQEDPPSEDSADQLRQGAQDMFRDEEDDDEEGFDMSVAELLYSTSSFYAIVIPGTGYICLPRFLFSLNEQNTI